MTCIIGYKDEKGIYIGGDSADIEGLDLIIREDPKVFERGRFVFGCTVSWRMIQILMHTNFGALVQDDDQTDFEFLCNDFIDFIKFRFNQKGFEFEPAEDYIRGAFILGYKNNLYVIKENYEIAIAQLPFVSVGCGFRYALGAMAAMRVQDSSTMIKKVLDIVSTLSAGVQGPFNIIHVPEERK